jgi:hypothetical protein
MKYEYKTVKANLADLEALNKMGNEGWEVCAMIGSEALLKKCLPGCSPVGMAKACANCKYFKTQDAKEASGESAGWCESWKLAMSAMGACEQFALKDISGAVTSSPAPAQVDEQSAWHWQSRPEFGEKRFEAITTQEEGVKAPSHKHRLVVIADKNGQVIRGKTDMVNGHDHVIAVMGTTDEADGHTHSWVPTSKT